MTTRAIVRVFEGHTLRVRLWRGRLVIPAAELGEFLGYAEGRKLSDNITGAWNDEFIAGVDYEVLEGDDLKEFEASNDYTESVESSRGGRRSLIVVTETGARLASIKARTPFGQKVRRWLAETWAALDRERAQAPAVAELPRRRRPQSLPSTTWPPVPTTAQRAAVRRAVVGALADHPELPFEDAALVEGMLLEGFCGRVAADDPPELLPRAAVLLLRAAGRVRWDRRRRVDAAAVTLELARMTTEPAPDPTAPH